MKRSLIALAALLLCLPCAALAGPRFDPPERTLPIAQRLPIAGQPATVTATIPYGGEVLRGAVFLGRARLATVHADVIMRMRDEAGLLNYATMVSDPHSLYYRHFLTPQQIGDYFGAPRSEYTRAIQYFWSQGLSVRFWKQREGLAVIGSQDQMERAFRTRFGVYRKDGVVFTAPINAPQPAIPLAIAGLGGIETYHVAKMRRHYVYGIAPRPLSEFGPGFFLGNTPFDLAAAFDYTGAYNISGGCCKGDGITIGIIGTGPIFTNSTGTAGDAVAFRSLFNVSGTGTVKQVNGTVNAPWMSTGVQPPPPVTGPCGGSLPGCNPEDAEAQLDTEQTNSLAPNAQVFFYLTYNPNECGFSGTCPPGAGSPTLGLFESDDELEQIANDNVADVISGSYGSGESDFAGQSGGLLNANGTGFEPTLFATLASQGITVFFSTGDSGAEECQPDGTANAEKLCVAYPADDPNVVAVGGTTTPIASNGQLSGIITTWGKQTQSGAGGGGFSSVFARSPFQPAGSFCADNAQCDSTHRLQPDVALNADPNTGVAILLNSGPGLGGTQIGSIGGTSAAAPGMAAMWALVLEACKQTVSCSNGPAGHTYRFGNPRALLYGLSAANKQAAFFDVTYGNNAVFRSFSTTVFDPGFNAGPGYDLTTGIGAPFARNLIKAVVGI